MGKRAKELDDTLESAAIEGAKEIVSFLGTYRGKDPDRVKRAMIGVSAVSGFTRYKASQNNLASVMLMAARQVGVPQSQQLEVMKTAGVLPESTTIEKVEK